MEERITVELMIWELSHVLWDGQTSSVQSAAMNRGLTLVLAILAAHQIIGRVVLSIEGVLSSAQVLALALLETSIGSWELFQDLLLVVAHCLLDPSWIGAFTGGRRISTVGIGVLISFI